VSLNCKVWSVLISGAELIRRIVTELVSRKDSGRCSAEGDRSGDLVMSGSHCHKLTHFLAIGILCHKRSRWF